MTLVSPTKRFEETEPKTEDESRTQRLKRKIIEADYEICIERMRYFTQAYKETEGEHPSLRAAKAIERTLDNYTIYILPELSSSIRTGKSK